MEALALRKGLQEAAFAGGMPRRSASLREGLEKTYRWIHDEYASRHGRRSQTAMRA